VSSNYNLHRAVLVAFQKNPSFQQQPRPTRDMVEYVVIYFRKNARGNLYRRDLLTDIVKISWDLIKQLQNGVPMPDPERFVEFAPRLSCELKLIRERGELFGVNHATLAGLTEKEIEVLTAPFLPL